MRPADEHHRAAGLARDRLHRALRRADEARSQQQVFRRVAGDGELGKQDEIGALRPGGLEPLENQPAVAVQIADDRVDLDEGKAHALSLTLFATLSRKPPSAGRTP